MAVLLASCGVGDTGTQQNASGASAAAPVSEESVSAAVLDTQSLVGSLAVALAQVNSAAPKPNVPHSASFQCNAGARPTLTQGTLAGQVSLVSAFPSLTFTAPIVLTQAPGDNSRWYVGEKAGKIIAFDNNPAATSKQTFLDLTGTGRVDATPGEGGLLGIAFHPNYAQNRYVYLSYTGRKNGQLTSFIARYTSLDNGATLSSGTEQIILELTQPYDNHNGGNIAFGPDGYLYAGFGDGGGAWDPNQTSQNPNTLLGKMIRIDVNGGSPYSIPPSNPYAVAGGRPEIYALGFRNPWRWSFDRGTAELWAGDVGEGTNEEIDRVELGKNYGWSIREGNQCFNRSNGGTYATGCQTAGLTDPVFQYTHTGGRCSITGGARYRGSAITAMSGRYVYGDYCTGEIWALNTSNVTAELLVGPGQTISTFAEDQGGEIYVANVATGKIHKLAPSSGTTVPFPTVLSQSGCVNMAAPYTAASGLVAFEINSPFWTDGAEKTRFISLPAKTQITTNSDGDWVFPIGTVLVKHLKIGSALIETRLLMRHTDGNWAGYSYKWNAAGTDAVLLTDHLTETINGVPYDFPSGAECLRCHTGASGVTLGPETGQINRRLATGVNQAELFKAMGLLPQSFSLLNMPFIAPWADTRYTVAQRARGYLHTNCSHCHRPGGGTPSDMDLRFSQPLWKTKACETNPVAGTLGLTNAKLIAPGQPASSVLLERMKRLDATRMPPLTTHLVDQGGTALVEQWIAGLQKCQ